MLCKEGLGAGLEGLGSSLPSVEPAWLGALLSLPLGPAATPLSLPQSNACRNLVTKFQFIIIMIIVLIFTTCIVIFVVIIIVTVVIVIDIIIVILVVKYILYCVTYSVQDWSLCR